MVFVKFGDLEIVGILGAVLFYNGQELTLKDSPTEILCKLGMPDLREGQEAWHYNSLSLQVNFETEGNYPKVSFYQIGERHNVETNGWEQKVRVEQKFEVIESKMHVTHVTMSHHPSQNQTGT